jgi:hypothetical protein
MDEHADHADVTKTPVTLTGTGDGDEEGVDDADMLALLDSDVDADTDALLLSDGDCVEVADGVVLAPIDDDGVTDAVGVTVTVAVTDVDGVTDTVGLEVGVIDGVRDGDGLTVAVGDGDFEGHATGDALGVGTPSAAHSASRDAVRVSAQQGTARYSTAQQRTAPRSEAWRNTAQPLPHSNYTPSVFSARTRWLLPSTVTTHVLDGDMATAVMAVALPTAAAPQYPTGVTLVVRRGTSTVATPVWNTEHHRLRLGGNAHARRGEHGITCDEVHSGEALAAGGACQQVAAVGRHCQRDRGLHCSPGGTQRLHRLCTRRQQQ